MICVLATVIMCPIINCKNIDTNILKKDNPVVPIDNKIIVVQNETVALQKNRTNVAQQNETSVKHNRSETNQTPETRKVSANVPVTTPSTVIDDMNAEQSSFYQSPLMIYPFSMINTYQPRYFPYTYPGYQGYPFFG